MNKIVYVTGCLGFIGYHVTKACLDKGWHVAGVDKMTYAANVNFLPELLEYKNFKFIEKDINDLERLYDCDYVIQVVLKVNLESRDADRILLVLKKISNHNTRLAPPPLLVSHHQHPSKYNCYHC